MIFTTRVRSWLWAYCHKFHPLSVDSSSTLLPLTTSTTSCFVVGKKADGCNFECGRALLRIQSIKNLSKPDDKKMLKTSKDKQWKRINENLASSNLASSNSAHLVRYRTSKQ
ncbi:unnamed protein product [Peronospora belbahrii]|uniref:Uncharacterized protein n=1 Tax=Peronospora belbahrii TaxID=622444 RepID=A0ABN8CNM1_9STRA|nr:unnamed protein product [Peronospora belbahrii]